MLVCLPHKPTIKIDGSLFTKNHFTSIIKDVWSQTAISEKYIYILFKQLVNIEFLSPSSSTIASRSKHDFEEWVIVSHGRVLIPLGC